MISKIEQVIEEIEAFIAGCKPQMLNSANVIVNREQMEEYLTDLRMKTPEEIRQYKKIISNKEAILADAQAKAESIIAEAQVEKSELVSQQEVMHQAYEEADKVITIAKAQYQEILEDANNRANDIQMGAIQYTNDMLQNLEDIISHAVHETTSKSESLLNSLRGCYDIVSTNRRQLVPAEEQVSEEYIASMDLEDDTPVVMVELD